MKPDIVVDVGNTRIKWGLCRGDSLTQTVSLPPSDPLAWQRQLESWELRSRLAWVIAGVHPDRNEEIANWVRTREDAALLLENNKKLPIPIAVPNPNGVGIDRLLNAVAARGRIQRRLPILIVDAGTAVTVDRVNANGEFEGGAILPGLRLMARALHQHTALLPLVKVQEVPGVPGSATTKAIEAGVFWSVAGGIQALLRLMGTASEARGHPKVFLTGGDACLLAPVLSPEVIVWPTMTLEGIRISAEALP